MTKDDNITIQLTVPKEMLGADLQQVRLALGQQALEQALEQLKGNKGGKDG